MNLKPAGGYIFVEPVDDIPSSKSEMGFGGKTDKQKPETPYKFRVVAVGGKVAYQGLWIYSEVEPGDIISHMSNNATLREQRETAGFVINGNWYLVIDFRDVLGIWRNNETSDAIALSNAIADAMPHL